MIDLKPFCGTEETRSYIMQPFSRGDFTYATDGHICVRVARLIDASEQDKPNVTKLPWEALAAANFVPAPAFNLPAKADPTFEPCDCYQGKIHDCPDCECECETCDGSGTIKNDDDNNKSVGLLGISFARKYVRLLETLPGLQVATIGGLYDGIVGLAFKFDGGHGLLMPLRRQRKDHVEVTI